MKANDKKSNSGGALIAGLGSIGALVVTYLIALVATNLLIWLASRMVTLPISFGSTMTYVIALVLTGIFYWYDRNNP
ncbi:MAG: hypothetical protein ACO3QC_02235 [Phycisphaerales bacterium]